MKHGTKLCDFWDRRSWYLVIMRRKIGQTRWIFGTGEVDIKSNKTNYGTKQGDFLGQEKLSLGYNKMKYGKEQVDFWDRRSWIKVIMIQILDWTRWLFGTGEFNIKLYQAKFGDWMRCFLGTGEVDFES